MAQILMPQLSESMERGTIVKWLVDDGLMVAVGDELVEIETDKSTVAYLAEEEGVLGALVPEGTTCDVGTPIAQIGPEALASGSPSESSAPAVLTTESPPVEYADETGALPESPTVALGHPRALSFRPGIAATPLALRSAHVHGVDLGSVHGTGPKGRVVQRDVLAIAGVEPSESPLKGTEAGRFAPSGEKGEISTRALTRLETIVAGRMTEASTVPVFQLQAEVNMEDAVQLRQKLKEVLDETEVPSMNDLIVKSCAVALRANPLANGSFTEQGINLHSRVTVGIAVAADGALLVPTVFDADAKSVGTIARETRRLVDRARSGRSTPADLSGGTFTVSNLGMFGMSAITPIINVPQAAILGVGVIRTVLRPVDEEVATARVMTVTLCCDHRILYGAGAAQFLADIRHSLENPLRLLL